MWWWSVSSGTTSIPNVKKARFVVRPQQNPEKMKHMWTQIQRTVCGRRGRCVQLSQRCKKQSAIYSFFQLNQCVYPLCSYVTVHGSVLLCPVQIYQTGVQCCALHCLFSNCLIRHISELLLNCLFSLSVCSTPDQPHFYWLWSWTELHLLWTRRTRHKVLGWLVWGPCDWELCVCGSLELKESVSWLTDLVG